MSSTQSKREERGSKTRTPMSKSKETKQKVPAFGGVSFFEDPHKRQSTRNTFELQFDKFSPQNFRGEVTSSEASEAREVNYAQREYSQGNERHLDEFQSIYRNDMRYLQEYREYVGKYQHSVPSLRWPYLFTECKDRKQQ